MTGPVMEKVVANALNLLDAAKADPVCEVGAVAERAVMVVLMLRTPWHY
jgi:hypothetical protein